MTRLFEDFLQRRTGLHSFFAGDWKDPAAWKQAGDRALSAPGPRAETARVLREANREWLTEGASSRLEAVEEGRGVVVVAGQQAGLLTGSLYTIHKAVTVLKLADWFEETSGVPTLPVFWAATNDSDLAEAGRVTVVDRSHSLATFEFPVDGDTGAQQGRPVGRIPLGSAATRLASWTEEVLPPTEFMPDLLAAVRDAYRPESTIGAAFISLMGHWLGPHGLVILDPLAEGLREPAITLYERVFLDPDLAGTSLEMTGESLKAAGYHRQLHMPANRLPLFATRDGDARRPLIPSGSPGKAEVEGSGTVEIARLLDAAGEYLLDPNAALRPVLQDWLLPTVAFVGGPSEVAYCAQLGPLYEGLGVTRALTVPRARVLLLPTVASRILEKYELEPSDLEDGPEAAAKKVAARQFPEDLDQAFDVAAVAIADHVEELKGRVMSFDPTLEKPFETSAGRMASELEKLKGKAISNQSRHLETLQQQMQKAATWLHPDGSAQERRLNLLPFAVRHPAGEALRLLLERVDTGELESVQTIPL